ncbi:MAG: OmpA family protein [Flavisolibacter sp.]|jgi:chemotaxis protein MotB
MHTCKILTGLMFIVLLSSCGAQKKLESTQGELEQAKKANASLTDENVQLHKEISDLHDGNQKASTDFASYRNECERTKKYLNSLEQDIADINALLQAADDRLLTAMKDFEDKGVQIYQKDGLIYVDFQEKLMYETGSSQLDPEGKQALAALADALNAYPKLKVTVVGNTDDKMFKKGSDNWTLSTERANGIVRILRDDFSVDPVRLTSAGRGKYDPVADNSTPEGRAQNRRTEIILSPDYRNFWATLLK